MINYNKKTFRPLRNSKIGETSAETLFNYKQEGNILFASYKGGSILKGHLLGKVSGDGKLKFSYHQINQNGELRTGICESTPEILWDGRIRLHEAWEWTNGDKSKGTSIIEEVKKIQNEKTG